MPNGYVFPYGITLSEEGKITTFPAAEVGFTTREGERITLLLLIDSGATISALPKTDAEVLGFSAEDGIPVLIAGIEGKAIRGWRQASAAGARPPITWAPFRRFFPPGGPWI